MHSVPSHSAHKPHDSDYSRNRARSIRFLILLAAILALAFFLSLRAGSYNTPAAELIRGIFGRASDAKINLVIRNNRLPRICTAMVAGAGLGRPGAFCRPCCAIRWPRPPRSAYRRAQHSAQPSPSSASA